MKRFIALWSLLVVTAFGTSTGCCEFQEYDFYLKLGSGVSFSESANISAPYSPWDPAGQGYNAKMGHTPIASLSVGCELMDVVDLEFTLANRSVFQYRKNQTSTITDLTYTRVFDLNVTSLLFTTNLLGRGVSGLYWNIGCGKIYPMVGVGLGASNLLITNFRTTGLAATGDSAPYPSFTSENSYTMRRNFTYTFMIGLEYSHTRSWAAGTGYRWFNAGSFEGPNYLRSSTGAAVDITGYAWDMRFRASEWFIEFKIFV